jgi:hypothetical protein
MRARNVLAASAAATALVLGAAAPVGAGESPIMTLSPNPAQVGDTVTITPVVGCPNYESSTPVVEIEVTGPEDQSFDVMSAYDGDTDRYEWTATFTAGPVGVYSVDASCVYPAVLADELQGRQQVGMSYQTATLQVLEPDPTTTTTTQATTTTAGESTTTTAAPAATAAAAVTARPAYTG